MALDSVCILLVEDNPGDALLLREFLSESTTFRYELIHAERLARALDLVADTTFDVALLDLTLPDARELEALRRLHALLPSLPIVVLTGLDHEATALQALEAGAQDYLVKGQVGPHLLMRSIQYAIQRNRAEEATRTLVRERVDHAAASAERARLQSLFMQAPTGICIVIGTSLTFEFANPLYCKIVGKKDLIGKTLLEAMPEIEGQGFDTLLKGVLDSGEPYFGKEILCRLDRNGDGSLDDVYFDFVYAPMRSLSGVVEGIMVVASDVTEQLLARRRVEEARRQTEVSEQRFQLLAEAIPQIVWSMDDDGQNAYLSPRWYEYTGQKESESIQEKWGKAIHPDDLARCFELWDESKRTRSTWKLEYRLRRYDGSYRWHLGRSVPQCDANGNILKWYGTATDIDEQRNAIRSRDDLLATVSHDLRNPLSSIVMGAGLLRRIRGPEELLSKLSSYAGTIERAANRMELLIRDLLDMASIESGHLSVEAHSFATAALVEEALETIQPLALDKALRLETRVPPEHFPVHCDRRRVLQVFTNILGNAVKFTPPAGRIAVIAEAEQQFVRFAVSDTGPGIAADQLPHVFDRFWQAKETARAGTGLGLAICKGIIQQHGGRIWVESELGAGTTFFFTLPLAGVALSP